MNRYLLIFIFLLAYAQIVGQCYNLVWQDEFDGASLDYGKWSHQTGAGGWGNNELQNYTDRVDNATVSNGVLQIIAKDEVFGNANYTSARIRSKDQGDWRYGKMEASIKLPIGQGIWPAFWMMPTESVYGTWPRSGEIDIMEYLGHRPSISYGTCHFGNSGNDKSSSGDNLDISPSSFADGAFHTFSIEWEPTQIRWYIDGVQFHTFNAPDVGAYLFPFDQKFHFILNIAVGGNWPGSPDGTTVFPQIMEVDYVRVYQELEDIAIVGNITEVPFATNVVYSLPDLAAATYTWTLPSGASIVGGAGTHSIVVDWANVAGNVAVVISNSCGSATLGHNVTLTANQAPNPGFEEDFSDWDPSTFNGAVTNWNITTTNVHAGSKAMCAEVTNLGANNWDIQISPATTELVGGEEYTLSFWGKADINNRTASLAIINNGNYSWITGATYAFTDTWAEYTHVFTATSTEVAQINLQFGHELGVFCLDDFLLAKTSDLPVTLAGIGFKVFLQGPFLENNSLMGDQLRENGFLPLSEPFTSMGFDIANLQINETITDASILDITGPDAIVDWVLVELRSANDPAFLLATRSALLQRDGDVVDLDGLSPLAFPNMQVGNYYIGIRHRNHLGVRTLNTLGLTAATGINLDFTDGSVLIAGTEGQINQNGTRLLIAGDATVDNNVDAADRSATWNNRNQTTYLPADVNMDGNCDAADRSIAWNNRNRTGE